MWSHLRFDSRLELQYRRTKRKGDGLCVREGNMSDAGLGLKISWFFYQKGMGVARPEYLLMTKFADEQWFKIAEVLFKDNNLEGRSLVLDQLLKPQNFRSHPKRPQFLRLMSQYLSKGIVDERRRVSKYIDDFSDLFTSSNDTLRGALITAQRDKDTVTANTAESALEKLGGVQQEDVKNIKKGYFR
jgi:hypothetical protein